MRPAIFALCLLLVRPLHCGAPERWFGRWFDAPKSGRPAHYEIKGTLDWPKKKFEGQMKLTWRNTGSAPTQELPFFLFLNSPAHSASIGGKARPGYCEIIVVKCNEAALDGRLGDGGTVFWARLPAPIKPGESVQVELSWIAQFPKIQAGSGWAGHYLVASLWYPKIGTYRGDGWLPAPPQENAAFSGDHAVFDVELSLPNMLQLANTGAVVPPMDQSGNFLTDNFGREVEAAPDPDRKLNFLYRLHAEDVKDFSWAAAPSGSWGLSGMHHGKTQIYFYCIPKNATQLRRLKDAAWNALHRLEQKFGPYPYPILSIVDLPVEASSALASPTLAFVSNIPFDPLNQRVVPELAALGQIGDQFFGCGAGPDAPDGNSLRQPLSSWFARKALEMEYQAAFTSKRFFMDASFPEWYAGHPTAIAPLGWLHGFLSRGLPGGQGRADAWRIDRLEAMYGGGWTESHIRSCVADNYFGPGARWDGFIGGATERPAWRIVSVSRAPQGGGEIAIEQASGAGDGPKAQPQGALALTLWVRLENGEEVSHVLGGQDDRVTFAFPAPISAAEIRPDASLLGQKDKLHTTYAARPLKRGVLYWAQFVIGAIGGLLQGIGVG